MDQGRDNYMPGLGWTALVRLNQMALFRPLGRAFYRLTSRTIAATCSRLPDVNAVYLTGSMASGDIAPGLSDIDIVVVIKDLPADRELRLIQHIERRLRYVMPPYAQDKSGIHLMIYAAREWQLVGHLLLGKRAGGPSTAFDRHDLPVPHRIDRQTLSLHHVFKGFWRLWDLQTRLGTPSKDKLDTLLRLRMCNRLLEALENSSSEMGPLPSAAHGLKALLEDTRHQLDRLQADGSEAGLRGLLPQLLMCFEQTAVCCLPVGEQGSATSPWSDQNAVADCDNFSASVRLADKYRGAVGNELNGHSIYVARLPSFDLVVCEPMLPEAIKYLIEAGPVQPGKTTHIASFRLLANLYMSSDFGPFAFVRVRDGVSFVAAGRLTPERFLLEAYAMFPKVRALSRLAQPTVRSAYSVALDRLILYAGEDREKPPLVDAVGCAKADEPGEDLTSGFADLRQKADRLTQAMGPSRDLLNI